MLWDFFFSRGKRVSCYGISLEKPSRNIIFFFVTIIRIKKIVSVKLSDWKVKKKVPCFVDKCVIKIISTIKKAVFKQLLSFLQNMKSFVICKYCITTRAIK